MPQLPGLPGVFKLDFHGSFVDPSTTIEQGRGISLRVGGNPGARLPAGSGLDLSGGEGARLRGRSPGTSPGRINLKTLTEPGRRAFALMRLSQLVTGGAHSPPNGIRGCTRTAKGATRTAAIRRRAGFSSHGSVPFECRRGGPGQARRQVKHAVAAT